MSTFRWATDKDVLLTLVVVSRQGPGDPGESPEVAIISNTTGMYWSGAGFTATPTFNLMTEVDPVNLPGLYTYQFQQSIVAAEDQYIAYFKNTGDVPSIDANVHVFSNEVFVPTNQPDPILFGANTVLAQLEQIKDGGTNLFDGSTDSLHNLKFDSARVLGLLHENAILDNQAYDLNNQLTSARLRVYESAVNVPASPGGSEAVGLKYQYQLSSEYGGAGILTKYSIVRVL